jgi:DNA-binding HxlR family transcriptional regulator
MGLEYAPDVFNSDCPAQKALDVIANKWTLLVILVLMRGPQRHTELRRKIPGLSQKVLTQTLRRLETLGLVTRYEAPGFPRFVEYSLSDAGWSLKPAVHALSGWAQDYALVLMRSA